jgi:single-strand DNA-binding protein
MASRSLNRVVLLGNLTRDPELKHTPAGTAVCTFGLATNRSWTTSDGTTKEEAQYHRIVAWQKLAELCEKLLTKGKKVYVEGRITYREFTTKDGQQKNITEIVLDDFIVFHEGKRSDNTKNDRTNGENSYTEDQDETGYPEESYDHQKKHTDVRPEDIGI